MLYIGADHRGYYLKEQIKKYLDSKKIVYKDMGSAEYKKDDDYPDIGYKVARVVAKRPKDRGILICGSGQGIAIVANKFRGVRAVTVFSKKDAAHVRSENNANIITLSGDDTSIQKARVIIDAFLATSFSLEKRHRRRVAKISLLEENKWKPK